MPTPVFDASTDEICINSPPDIHRRHDVSSYVDDWSLEEHDEILSLSDISYVRYIDPSINLAKKQHDIAQKHVKAFQASTARLNELKKDARTEGHTVSSGSEKDLMTFLSEHVFTCRPFITLLDNGNLRALWKTPEGEQIGLQFRGGNEVQYVLFADRTDRGFMARSSGRDALSDIDGHINVHNLERLLAA